MLSHWEVLTYSATPLYSALYSSTQLSTGLTPTSCYCSKSILHNKFTQIRQVLQSLAKLKKDESLSCPANQDMTGAPSVWGPHFVHVTTSKSLAQANFHFNKLLRFLFFSHLSKLELDLRHLSSITISGSALSISFIIQYIYHIYIILYYINPFPPQMPKKLSTTPRCFSEFSALFRIWGNGLFIHL